MIWTERVGLAAFGVLLVVLIWATWRMGCSPGEILGVSVLASLIGGVVVWVAARTLDFVTMGPERRRRAYDDRTEELLFRSESAQRVSSSRTGRYRHSS